MDEWETEQLRYMRLIRQLTSLKWESETAPMHEMRRTLLSKLDVLKAKEYAFSHSFHGRHLGFSLALSRYGDERHAVEVHATRPDCELSDMLRPRDELVAIDDDIIVCNDTAEFTNILLRIRSAPRPLTLTFVKAQRAPVIELHSPVLHTFSQHDLPCRCFVPAHCYAFCNRPTS